MVSHEYSINQQQPSAPPAVHYTGQQQDPTVAFLPQSSQPVTVQPQGISSNVQSAQVGWMPAMQQMSNASCPPGLEYLTAVDQLLVHQKVEVLEVLTGWETANRYTVKNSVGQIVYEAKELSDCFFRQFCGSLRPFDMKLDNNFGTEVIHLNRPLACASFCCFCCLQSMEVSAPPGNVVGYVKQECTLLLPRFSVQDASGETVLLIKGPLFTSSCFGSDVDFDVYTADGDTKIGKITKQWSGVLREMLTDADNFGVSFPMDLDVKMKATLLGACFLIDFMFYENTDRDHQH